MLFANNITPPPGEMSVKNQGKAIYQAYRV